MNFNGKFSVSMNGFLYFRTVDKKAAINFFKDQNVYPDSIEYFGLSEFGGLKVYRARIKDGKAIKWTVSPLNSQGNPIADPVHVTAILKAGAERSGKIWLRTLGVKRVSWVQVSPMLDFMVRF